MELADYLADIADRPIAERGVPKSIRVETGLMRCQRRLSPHHVPIRLIRPTGRLAYQWRGQKV